MSDDKPKVWEPSPIDEEKFHENSWADINRAPYDEVSGVIYKRNGNIKRVRYSQGFDDGEDALVDGRGEIIARWLFSESASTEEGLLTGRQFEFLQDAELANGSCSAEQAQVASDLVFYVISGEGKLHHRPHEGSPVMTRPLRPGDAVLINRGELYAIAHDGAEQSLRVLLLGLN